MKKWLLPLLMVFVLILAACGNQQSSAPADSAAASQNSSSSDNATTITYQSETGPIEVPAHPQRVIALDGYAGNVMKFGVPLVGVDSWTMASPNFKSYLDGVTEVSADNLEKIIELKPDLIIAGNTVKNADKLKQIAPLVTYTYNKVDYLTQVEEVAKAINKADEGAAWVADFKKRAAKAGSEIKAKIGDDASVTVMEGDSKQLYVFGDAWGRGTEIIYQAMGLKMPEKVKAMTSKDGYYDLSLEVLPDYLGDYVIYSKDPSVDASFQNTDTYKNIPAVKNKHVYEADARGFYFNDAVTLDYQLDFITKSLLG
ncbi:iron-hydroxamate ABC transporter substrate-binding protein [Paenibacillus bovis]|uniref:ABC transporter substrate-binding protein n=1 Tax=Paenibacillus bovis TaxID=1616788 RepID=A0A172ZIL6_9BACL|nr:iron-hydroxamate ABC transporter substrate-binding protein [Paenibacillus bovis]ANF97481.1 ABC transporter substrate-binding protein [Paenibacillus bovis]